MKPTVLYHASCADGFGAAWAAWLKLGELADYIPVQYGRGPIPEFEPGGDVYILDFSYSREELILLAARSSCVVVLDHHKTARTELEGWKDAPPGLMVAFDMNRSGANLAWCHFHDGPIPTLIRYIEDRDLWRWSLPESRAFSQSLASTPMEFHAWTGVAEQIDEPGGFESFVAPGRAILGYQDQQVARLAAKAIKTVIGGHLVSAVNSPVWQSEIGERLLKNHPDAPFAAIWFDPDLGSTVWSLRSRGDFDVSAIAKTHGGGGHAAAAGFTRHHEEALKDG